MKRSMIMSYMSLACALMSQRNRTPSRVCSSPSAAQRQAAATREVSLVWAQ